MAIDEQQRLRTVVADTSALVSLAYWTRDPEAHLVEQ